jgi:hypothetical protein
MKVFKYEIKSDDSCEIIMEAGAEILCVQTQNEHPFIWVLTEEDGPLEKRKFKLYGTGHDIYEEKFKYIGTFQLAKGSLVFHLFEVFD